jgi:peptidoglycan hydrolase-like protein with peptidoglycan-binding domain
MQVMPTVQEAAIHTPGRGSYVVELLQRALVRAGFDPGPVNGDFRPGSMTAAAVRGFQAANGLVANGIVGPETWLALPAEDMQGLPRLQLGSQGGAVALVSMASLEIKRGIFLANGNLSS